MPIITLLAFYMGDLPNWITLWLKTCGNNPDIRFILIVDKPVEANLPPNVRVIVATLLELKERFSDVLGMNVVLDIGYKLCDYRPTFGLTFKEELDGSDFWGHVDLDQLFGHIISFLPQHDIYKYDRIFHRGHFTLYRNNEIGNNLFSMPHPTVHAKDTFLTSKNTWFDETAGIYQIVCHNNVPQYENNHAVGDLVPRIPRFALGDKSLNRRHQAFVIEDGRAIQVYEENGTIQRREFMYFHFQKRKFPDILEAEFEPVSSWRITPYGFLPGLPLEWTGKTLDENNKPNYAHIYQLILSAGRKRLHFIGSNLRKC